MSRDTASTAVLGPYTLVTASMRICATAAGSSHGRELTGLDWDAIMCCVRLPWGSEIRRRCGAAARRSKERALYHPCPHHPPLPYQLAVEIDLGPQLRTDAEVRGLHHRQRQVALAGRRPGRRGDAARLAPAAAVDVQQRVVRRLVALDIEPHQTALRTALMLREQGPSPGEVTLFEVNQPRESQLER